MGLTYASDKSKMPNEFTLAPLKRRLNTTTRSSKYKGTRLIDVWVDSNGYSDQLKSLRG